jgi:hypothetical protein
MNLFFLNAFYPPAKKHKDDPSEQVTITVPEPLHNISDGSEFLDDAIRMKEQPLMFAEESIAAGSPENFW